MKLPLSNLLDKRLKLVRTALPGFDPIYYLFWYPDVRSAGLDPLQHYLDHGWKEGRDPSAGFSTSGYIAKNPDVAQAGHNPLVHFVNSGFAEGRKGFDKNPNDPAPRARVSLDPVKLLPPPDKQSATQIDGFVDEITHIKVRGWARPFSYPQGAATVEITVDGSVAGSVLAGAFRQDLKEAEIGSGHHGFEFWFPSSLDASKDHNVIVRRAEDGWEIGRVTLKTNF